jgi:hypothetical protein
MASRQGSHKRSTAGTKKKEVGLLTCEPSHQYYLKTTSAGATKTPVRDSQMTNNDKY